MGQALSVIVPVYNVESYLRKCLDSILVQTFRNFELILVNDGSTDNSGRICNVYEEKDSRVKVIHQNNEGVSSARNAGIKNATGKYIAFVDPDDTVEEDMYKILIEEAKKCDAELVVCPIRTVNLKNNTTSVSTIWKCTSTLLDRHIIACNIIPEILNNKTFSLVSCVNKLYERSLLNVHNLRFDEHKHHSEDVTFNLKLLTCINKLVYVEKPLYNYYKHKRHSLTQVFRADLYEYILDNKKNLIELANKYHLKTHIDKICNHYSGLTLAYIDEVINSSLDKNEKYKILSHIINDNSFKKDIIKYRCPTIYFKFLKVICILKSAGLLYRFVKAKHRFQSYKNKKSRYEQAQSFDYRQ